VYFRFLLQSSRSSGIIISDVKGSTRPGADFRVFAGSSRCLFSVSFVYPHQVFTKETADLVFRSVITVFQYTSDTHEIF
jgi:hypothetical protein